MKHLRNRDGDEAVKGLVALGWTTETCTNHLIVRNPADRDDRFTLSKGRHLDPEHVKKIRSRLRKALYEAAERVQDDRP